jgi:hypothetical protein
VICRLRIFVALGLVEIALLWLRVFAFFALAAVPIGLTFTLWRLFL